MALSFQASQPRAVGIERARHMLDHRDVGIKRSGFGAGVHGAEAVLRHAAHRNHRDPRYPLDRSFWLRTGRRLPADICLARRVGVLGQSTDGKNTPGAALAGRQEVKAAPRVLGRVRGHVRVRNLPGLHLSMAQFRIDPVLGFDARDGGERASLDESVWRSDEQSRSRAVQPVARLAICERTPQSL